MKAIALDREFTEENFNKMIDFVNTAFTNIELKDNMNGQVIENIQLPANADEVAISHNLKLTPKYRILLRQDADGVVIDGTTEWDNKKIYLKLATSGSLTTISILLMRG